MHIITNIINNMVKNSDNSYGFNENKRFQSYKKYQKFKHGLNIEALDKKNEVYVNEQYFTCINCEAVNPIKSIQKEVPENRTFRCRHKTWKKLKDIANDKGFSLENGLNYLIYLHEQNQRYGSDNDIPVAAGPAVLEPVKDDKDKVKDKKHN